MNVYPSDAHPAKCIKAFGGGLCVISGFWIVRQLHTSGGAGVLPLSVLVLTLAPFYVSAILSIYLSTLNIVVYYYTTHCLLWVLGLFY